MTLRRATPADKAKVVSLVQAFYRGDGYPFNAEKILPALQPLLEHDDYGVVYFIEPAHGYIVLTWGWSLESGGREALIDEFYIEPQGQGFGAATLRALYEELPKLGVKKIFLETERQNPRARGLYLREGFDEDDSIWLSKEL